MNLLELDVIGRIRDRREMKDRVEIRQLPDRRIVRASQCRRFCATKSPR